MIPMDDDEMTVFELSVLVAIGMVGGALYRAADRGNKVMRRVLAKLRDHERRS